MKASMKAKNMFSYDIYEHRKIFCSTRSNAQGIRKIKRLSVRLERNRSKQELQANLKEWC